MTRSTTSAARIAGTALAALAALAIACPALAHQESGGAESPNVAVDAAKDDLRFVLAGGYAHFFSTDFDTGGGEVGVDRGFGSLNVSSAPKDTYRWDIDLSWEGSWYSFDNGGSLATAAGGTPWDAVQSIVITPGASFKLDDHWRVNARFLLQFAGENDADVGDSATYGGILAASYSFSDTFTLGLGALVTSRIEDDVLVVPQIIIDWRPCKEFRLSNFAGPEAFPGGAGLEAIWVLNEEFEIALGARYTYRRFRLSDEAPVADGVGTDQGMPTWIRATMRAKCGARVDLVGGFQFAGEMQLDDSNGNQLEKVDVESAPFLGVFMSWKF
jgi:hypothetical protein